MFIKFKIDKDNLVKFYSDNIVKTKASYQGKILLYILLFFIVVFIWSVTNDQAIKIVFTISILVTSLFINKLFKITCKDLINKKLSKEKHLGMFQEIHIKDHTLYIKTSSEDTNINFDYISSIHIADGYLLIVLTKAKYYPLPLSAFDSVEERTKFISLLEEKSNKNVINSYPDKLIYN